jgi:hypothetical protein
VHVPEEAKYKALIMPSGCTPSFWGSRRIPMAVAAGDDAGEVFVRMPTASADPPAAAVGVEEVQ